MLHDYRYTIPNPNDKNRNRWPTAVFWQSCMDNTKTCLAEYMCGAVRRDIIEGQQEVIVNRYRDHLKGLFTSLTAAQGFDISELPMVLEGFHKHILESVSNNPRNSEKIMKKQTRNLNLNMGKRIIELLAG